MSFQVKNSNIFPLPGNSHMLHLGTIVDGFKEYIVMICINGSKKGNVYIEEVTLNSVNYTDDVYAYCKFIQDDNLAEDLARFAEEKGLTDMKTYYNRLLDPKTQNRLYR